MNHPPNFLKPMPPEPTAPSDYACDPILPAATVAMLSFVQERLWFLDRLSPGEPIYNLTGVYRTEQVIDPELVHRCVNELVHRHEPLRLCIEERDGKLEPRIRDDLIIDVPLINLMGVREEERQNESERLIHELP